MIAGILLLFLVVLLIGIVKIKRKRKQENKKQRDVIIHPATLGIKNSERDMPKSYQNTGRVSSRALQEPIKKDSDVEDYKRNYRSVPTETGIMGIDPITALLTSEIILELAKDSGDSHDIISNSNDDRGFSGGFGGGDFSGGGAGGSWGSDSSSDYSSSSSSDYSSSSSSDYSSSSND